MSDTENTFGKFLPHFKYKWSNNVLYNVYIYLKFEKNTARKESK